MIAGGAAGEGVDLGRVAGPAAGGGDLSPGVAPVAVAEAGGVATANLGGTVTASRGANRGATAADGTTEANQGVVLDQGAPLHTESGQRATVAAEVEAAARAHLLTTTIT